MKVIDLLNKIANNEEVPLKIKVKGYEYRQSNGQFWCDETEMYLIDNCTSIYQLNDEIEIIEEDKKIEKLESFVLASDDPMLTKVIAMIANKIGEIIDYINKGD